MKITKENISQKFSDQTLELLAFHNKCFSNKSNTPRAYLVFLTIVKNFCLAFILKASAGSVCHADPLIYAIHHIVARVVNRFLADILVALAGRACLANFLLNAIIVIVAPVFDRNLLADILVALAVSACLAKFLPFAIIVIVALLLSFVASRLLLLFVVVVYLLLLLAVVNLILLLLSFGALPLVPSAPTIRVRAGK